LILWFGFAFKTIDILFAKTTLSSRIFYLENSSISASIYHREVDVGLFLF